MAGVVHLSAESGGDLEARYANYFEVGHTDVEFILLFGQSYSTDTPPSVHTRVVTDPTYIRTLIALLDKSLKEYETDYGGVQPPREGTNG